MSNPLRAITMRAREYARRDREMSNEEAMGLAIAGASTLVLLGGAYYWLQNGKKTPAQDQINLILGVMCRRVDATTILGDKAALGAIKKELEELQSASKASEGVLESLNDTKAALLAKESAFDTLTAAHAAKERELEVISAALAKSNERVGTSGVERAENALLLSQKEANIKLLNDQNLTLENQLAAANNEVATASAENARVEQELATHKSNNPSTAAEVTELNNQLAAAKVAQETAESRRDAAETRAAAATKEAAESLALAENRTGAADQSAGLIREKWLLEGQVGEFKREAGRTTTQIDELQKRIETQSAELAALHQVRQQLVDSQAAASLAQNTVAATSDYVAVKAERDRLTAALVNANTSNEQLTAFLLTARDRADAAEQKSETMPTVKGELETAKSTLLAKEAALLAATTELGKVRDEIAGLQKQVSDLSRDNTAIAGATQRADDAEARLAGFVTTRDGDIAKAVKGAEAAKDALIAMLQSAKDDLTKQLSGCERDSVIQNAEILRLVARETELTLGGQAVTADLAKSEAALLVAKKETEGAKTEGEKTLKKANADSARKITAEESKTGVLQKEVDELKGQLLCLWGEKVRLEASVALYNEACNMAARGRNAAEIAASTAGGERDFAVGVALSANDRTLTVQNESTIVSNTLAAILAVLCADRGDGERKARSLVADAERLVDLETQIRAATDALDAVIAFVRELGSELAGKTDARLPEPVVAPFQDVAALGDKVDRQVKAITVLLAWTKLLVKADTGAERLDALRDILVRAGSTAVDQEATLYELKGVITAFGHLIGCAGGDSGALVGIESAYMDVHGVAPTRPSSKKDRSGVTKGAPSMAQMATYAVGLLEGLYAARKTEVMIPVGASNRRARARQVRMQVAGSEQSLEVEPGESDEDDGGKRTKPFVAKEPFVPRALMAQVFVPGTGTTADTNVKGKRMRTPTAGTEGEEAVKPVPHDFDKTPGEWRTLPASAPDPDFGVEGARALPMGASLWGHMLGCARRIADARAGAALTLDGARATSAALGWLLRIVESKLLVRARLEKMNLLPPAAQSFGRGCRGPIRRARMYI